MEIHILDCKCFIAYVNYASNAPRLKTSKHFHRRRRQFETWRSGAGQGFYELNDGSVFESWHTTLYVA
jgi:hypothetical protein